MIQLSYTKKKYSDKEYLRIIQKRVKIVSKGINPNKEIIVEASSRNFAIIKAMLLMIFKDPIVKNGNSNIKAMSFEEEASIAIKNISEGKKHKKLQNLLSKVTEEDIKNLCRILDIEYKKANIHPFLVEILEKHPDVAFGFMQSLGTINE